MSNLLATASISSDQKSLEIELEDWFNLIAIDYERFFHTVWTMAMIFVLLLLWDVNQAAHFLLSPSSIAQPCQPH